MNQFSKHFFIWKVSLLLLMLCGLGLSVEAATKPSIVSPEDAERLVNKLPDYTRSGYSGLAFYGKNLYATSGIGLLEFEGNSLKNLYRWNKSDSDVEGPWVNLVDGQLWVWRAGDDRLGSFDGKAWHEFAMPQPKKGYFSRGDILDGFFGVSSTNAFWLTGGGCAWSWDLSKKMWTEQLDLPAFKNTTRSGTLERLFLLGDKPFVVVRYEPGWAVFGRARHKNLVGDTVHYFDKHWLQVSNNAVQRFFVEQTVSVGGKGFIRTIDGELLQVDPSNITKLETPGFCEALAVTSAGTILASFHNLGVYELTKDWKLRFKAPYPSTDGEHWVYLAENDGQIALSVRPVPQLVAEKNSSNYKTVYDSFAALWIFDGQKLENIPLLKNKLDESHH